MLTSFLCLSQDWKTLPNYPEGQDAYAGGREQLYKDLHQIIKDNNLANCKTYQNYFVNLKISESGKPVYTNPPKKVLEEEKCSYDMMIKSIGMIKNWQPAQKNNGKKAAFYGFIFNPKVLIQDDIQKVTYPRVDNSQFPGGVNAFREDFRKMAYAYLDYDTYLPKGRFVLSFDVNINGKLDNFSLEPKVENYEILLKDLEFCAQRIKNKWSPAKQNGIAVKTRFNMPINFGGVETYDHD
ncbi:hypothetical protein [Epilithonimonas arachidiradicis]|uniref:hypothetical protein n=1 Tax=Epilithonimonas arachidiradicis TaxID=1617282 RepID=UPI0011C21BB2|nr:hypothetical protein [Epilithonimonas arachidiradicis]